MIDLFHGNPAKMAAHMANESRIRTIGVMVMVPAGSKPKRKNRVCP